MNQLLETKYEFKKKKTVCGVDWVYGVFFQGKTFSMEQHLY